MRKNDLLDILEKIALDKSLKGADIRIALLLADTLRRPGDLIKATGMAKSNISHCLRHLMDAGYITLQIDDQGQRWYGLKERL